MSRNDRMRRVGVMVWLLVGTALVAPTVAAAGTPDPLPIIVTYELKKQRREARLLARNPRAFWIRQIVARLEDKRPSLATPLKQPVTVRVSFVVGRDGHLVSTALSQSSGNGVADKTAMEMLAKAQPFPPMPTGMDDKELAFTVPVRFR